MTATLEALNSVWHELIARQERERQAVAGMLNVVSGFTRTTDQALAELDQGLRALVPPLPDPLALYPQHETPRGPARGQLGAEQVQSIASQLGEPDAEFYLNRLDKAR